MKKIVSALAVLVGALAVVQAEILAPHFRPAESEAEFDVIYYVYDEMQIFEDTNEDVSVTQSFKVNLDGIAGEIKYSLFTDTGVSEARQKQEFMMYAMLCMLNASGFSNPADLPNGRNFNDADVAKEFNGDFGFTCFIQQPKSTYAGDNACMNVEFFYKAGQGMVMRSFLSNDVRFFGVKNDGTVDYTAPYFKYYHTFKFIEP